LSGIELYQFQQAYLFSQTIQRFARYNLRAGIGQKTFTPKNSQPRIFANIGKNLNITEPFSITKTRL
jgi:hypothetical protein